MSLLKQSPLHIVKQRNSMLSCQTSRPLVVFGFRFARHAGYVANKLKHYDFKVCKETHYTLHMLDIKPHEDKNIQVESSSDIHLALLCKLSDLKLEAVSDIIIESNKCIHFISDPYDMDEVYTNEKMVIGNLTKLLELH